VGRGGCDFRGDAAIAENTTTMLTKMTKVDGGNVTVAGRAGYAATTIRTGCCIPIRERGSYSGRFG
jgi:hypothetical protein